MDSNNSGINRRHFLNGAGSLVALSLVGNPGILSVNDKNWLKRRNRVLSTGKPEEVGMSSDRLGDVQARLKERVDRGLIPGFSALVARHGKVVLHTAYGTRQTGTTDPLTTDTLFDLESNTKVLSTATAVLMLVERGKLKLTDKVATYLPEFATAGKGNVTIRDMLRYSSGLPVDNNKLDGNPAEIWKFMEDTPLEYPTGTAVEYSDLTYRLLGHLVEKVAGMDLDRFGKKYIWGPLGMKDTTYNPPDSLKPRCAATGPGSFGLRPSVQRGVVQDDQDWVLGGIVGCDGLFSTTGDIAIFCQMILNGGSYKGVEILKPATVLEMTASQTPQVTEATTDDSPIDNLILTPKGYGWELWTNRFSSGGMRLSPGSFGKAGGAGTFMWIDPYRDLFGIILTNHGLPVPFDGPGWANMLDAIGVYQYYDGIINAITREDD